MCTAVSLNFKNSYYGRNLDYEHDFGESVVITPRNLGFTFSDGSVCQRHYAIIGMALPKDGYPLYFDAVNEEGLWAAGLRFNGFSMYTKESPQKINIASYEVITRLLCLCKNLREAEDIFKKATVTDIPFSKDLPPAPMHWIMGDKTRTVTIEQTKEGLNIYENTVGVLTNNPDFNMQMLNLSNYTGLTAKEANVDFSGKIPMTLYSKGMGAIGLPGDLSSMSRFVKASFLKLNSKLDNPTEDDEISLMFNILYSVYQIKGCVETKEGHEITNYTCCCDVSKGVYMYTTYGSIGVYGIDMHKENLDQDKLIIFDLAQKQGKKILN